MGLLDTFGVNDEDRGGLNYGLLNAGLHILANNKGKAGPTIANGLLQGISSYQGYQKQKLLDEINKMKADELKTAIQNMREFQTALKRRDTTRQVRSGFNQQPIPPAMNGGGFSGSWFGGQMSSPQMESMAANPIQQQLQVTDVQSGVPKHDGIDSNQDYYNWLLEQSQSNPYALEHLKKYTDVMPNYSKVSYETLGDNNTVNKVVTDQFGNPKMISVPVAEDLNQVNLGGKVDLIGKKTGKTKRSMSVGMTPYQEQSLGLQRQRENRIASGGGMNGMAAKSLPTKPDKPLNEGQSNATSFAGRMASASKILDKFGYDNYPTFSKSIAGGLTNFLATEEGQMARQAEDNWITALLRKDSGAAVPQKELDQYRNQYFPTIGDSPRVIKQKSEARKVAERAMQVSAGQGAARIDSIVNGAPEIGVVIDGHRYVGGNPATPSSWVKETSR